MKLCCQSVWVETDRTCPEDTESRWINVQVSDSSCRSVSVCRRDSADQTEPAGSVVESTCSWELHQQLRLYSRKI